MISCEQWSVTPAPTSSGQWWSLGTTAAQGPSQGIQLHWTVCVGSPFPQVSSSDPCSHFPLWSLGTTAAQGSSHGIQLLDRAGARWMSSWVTNLAPPCPAPGQPLSSPEQSPLILPGNFPNYWSQAGSQGDKTGGPGTAAQDRPIISQQIHCNLGFNQPFMILGQTKVELLPACKLLNYLESLLCWQFMDFLCRILVFFFKLPGLLRNTINGWEKFKTSEMAKVTRKWLIIIRRQITLGWLLYSVMLRPIWDYLKHLKCVKTQSLRRCLCWWYGSQRLYYKQLRAKRQFPGALGSPGARDICFLALLIDASQTAKQPNRPLVILCGIYLPPGVQNCPCHTCSYSVQCL